jgi:hypothetical protein
VESEDKAKPSAAKTADKKSAPKAKAAASKSAETPPAATPAPEVMASSTTVMPSSGAAKSEPASRRGWWVIGGTVVGLVVLFLVVFGVLIYKYKSDSRIVQIVASVVPYPAESVNGHWVSYSDYLFEVNSIKHYYLSQSGTNGQPAVNFSSASGKQKLTQLEQQVMTELQQEAIVKQIASKEHVTVSSAAVQAQVNQITKSAGGTDKVKQVLQKFYGWNIGDLQTKIKFQLLEQNTTTAVQNDATLNAAAQAKAQTILKQLKGGANFATLAKKYSQDSSAANGGDLGFFSKSQVVPAFANAAFALQPGQISGVVKTEYGYSIIECIAYNSDKSQIHAAQILIKSVDFNTYLQQQVNQAKIHTYIHP